MTFTGIYPPSACLFVLETGTSSYQAPLKPLSIPYDRNPQKGIKARCALQDPVAGCCRKNSASAALELSLWVILGLGFRVGGFRYSGFLGCRSACLSFRHFAESAGLWVLRAVSIVVHFLVNQLHILGSAVSHP